MLSTVTGSNRFEHDRPNSGSPGHVTSQAEATEVDLPEVIWTTTISSWSR